ncbi:alcohol dehydrogenase catalytic domain-containing protein [Desulfosporosinus sp. SB140]
MAAVWSCSGMKAAGNPMGIVEELGKDVANLKKGDRVIVSFPVACGHSRS